MNRRGRCLAAVAFAVLMVLSPMAATVGATANYGGSAPADVADDAIRERAPGDASSGSGATGALPSQDSAWAQSLWPDEARAGTADGGSSGEAAERTPPRKHLGYGGPAGGSAAAGGVELSVGAPPVPPSGTPSGTPAADDASGPSTPLSVPEAVKTAQNGNLDEVKSQVNGETLSKARKTEQVSAMTRTEQAAAMRAMVSSEGGSAACPEGATVRTFNVSAIQVSIDYNKYGQHDPDGAMYALDRNVDDILAHERNEPNATIDNPDPNVTSELVQPLTIRANVGDCVKIKFTNRLNQSASMHPSGLSYGPDTSAGSAVGFSEESVAQPNESVTYTWRVEKKGAFFFTDKAQSVFHDKNETLRQHGLFGSLVAYEQGTKWLDPQTGEPTKSGQKVMIEDPDGPDYRDFAVYYHDGMTIKNADGSHPTWPNSNAEQSMYAMNYRGDPTGARLRERNESVCPACDKPETFYSSWVHGDPGGGDLVFPAYLGDPVKWRLIGAQIEEKHVDHHHGHRWKSEPGDPASNTQDAQTVSAGATYTRDFVAGFGNGSERPSTNYTEAFESGGAGYVQGSPGDYIFHCHLFPHYAEGMWSIMRVYEKDTRDMDASKPGVIPLQPLPDREEPPAPNASDPGYPNFVPAEEGERPPKPPGEVNGRDPTPLEESAMNGSGVSDPIVPGAPYANPCPSNATVQQYNISLIETNITYNNAGDYDENAKIYVLDKWIQGIRNGSRRPRPLVIRANVGQCVEINFTNRLPADHEPDETSMHTHFVGYDALGSDGVTLGYNYDEGAEPINDSETRTVAPENGSSYTVESTGTKSYRWYADERGTIFWHDHLSGFEEGMHGTFGALIVEPKGSEWLSPYTGEPKRAGTKAMIVDNDTQNHREYVLLYQDFVRLRNASGSPINGPFTNTPLEDQGTMGISYSNAPLYRRTEGSSSYAFSTVKHEDPLTPLLEAYPEEPVKIRVLQGTFEESHNFMINGVDWKQEPNDPSSPTVAAQSFGVSEQFVANFKPPERNPFDVRMNDYMYGSNPIDDLWNGMWGLMRVWGVEVPWLEPLPGHSAPKHSIKNKQLSTLKEYGLRKPTEVTSGSDGGDGNDKKGGGKGGDNDGGGSSSSLDDSKSADPPKALSPGDPCPDGADTRSYTVVAFQRNISYNDYGDHDPYGIAYATRSQYEKIKNGTIDEIEPMVLRAEKGECIEVTLQNRLPTGLNNHTDHAKMPVSNSSWENSDRISLHPTLLDYEVERSDGASVGFNWGQSASPGGNITYRWFADEQVGTTQLFDMANVRNHRHHGAFGMLIVEPENSKWLDPRTGEPIETGTRAVVVQPNGQDFREYALAMTDGMYVVNADGSCPVPVMKGRDDNPDAPCNQAHGDAEDQGFKGINYDSAPLSRRLDSDEPEWSVFSSRVNGDPATPVLEAYVNDPVKFRVAQTADKPRGVSFELGGHTFPYQSTEQTQYMGVRGEIIPGKNVDIVPYGGAGGAQNIPGDYYYGATKLRNFVEGGLWGVFRVHDEGDQAGVIQLPGRAHEPENPAAETPDAERELEVSWDAPTDTTVEHFNVYRAPAPGGPYEKVNDKPVTNTTFRDTGRNAGGMYHYVVTAVDDEGEESYYSAESAGTTKPLLDVTDETDRELDAPANENVTLEVEAASEAGLDRVRVDVQNETTSLITNEEATYNATSGYYEVTIDTRELDDGNYTVRFRARDVDGRRTERFHPITVDNTPPSAAVSVDGTAFDELSSALTDTVTLGVDSSDVHGVSSVEYRLDGGNWTTISEQNGSYATGIDTTALADGDHTLDVRVTDTAGNSRRMAGNATVDNDAPSASVAVDGTALALLSTPVSGSVPMTVDASDAGTGVETVEYRLDGGNWTAIAVQNGSYETSVDTTALADGDHTLAVRVTDGFGRTTERNGTVTVDNTAPTTSTTVDDTPIDDAGTLVGTVTLGVNASDSIAGTETVEYRLDGGSWRALALSSDTWTANVDTTALADGDHTLDVRVTDAAGNARTSGHTVTVDNSGPTVDTYVDGTLASDLAAAVNDNVTLRWSAGDMSGVDSVEYAVDSGDYTSVPYTNDTWSTTLDTTTLSDGNHTVTGRVTDGVGHTTEQSVTVEVDNTEPSASVAVEGTALTELNSTLNGTVTLTADASDASGVETVEYRLDDGNWSALGLQNDTWTTDIDTTTLSDGNHTLSVRVVDTAGNVYEISATVEIDNV